MSYFYNIPLTKEPNQVFITELNGKVCEFEIVSRYGFTFMNLTVDDEVQFKGVICQNRNNILQYSHYKLGGELMFMDTQGQNDPEAEGFGERYLLVYVSE